MRNFKKLFTGLLLSSSLALSLVGAFACGDDTTPGDDGGDTHVHEFDTTTWAHDETNHWNPAKCIHKDVKGNEAPHADEDNDGECDVCGYDYDHTHTYSDEWSHDAEAHYHAATCGHDIEPADRGAHADEDNNGLCDICGYDYDHTHTYSEGWTHDDDNHWHAATCEHDVVSDKAAHVDKNNDGVCDTCGWDYDHTHTFDETAWVSNENGHFHEASCSHDVYSEVIPHVDEDYDGECDVCGYEMGHEHVYSKEWSHDVKEHWHAAECGHVTDSERGAHVDANADGVCDTCLYDYVNDHDYEWMHDEPKDNTGYHWLQHQDDCGCECTYPAAVLQKAHHVDENNDGICDTCGWDYDHKHTYSEEWSSDSKNHWHAVTCGHNVEVADKAEHKDWDNDGACNVCNWYDENHVHTYEDTWSYNASQHFHKGTCGHDVINEAEAEDHTFADGKCSVCGAVQSELIGIEDVLALISATTADPAYSTGRRVYDNPTYGDPSDNAFIVEKYDNCTYILSAAEMLFDDTPEIEGGGKPKQAEFWFALLNDTPVALQRDYDGDLVKYNTTLSMDYSEINGLEFADFSNITSYANFYGVHDMITGLYAAAKDLGESATVTTEIRGSIVDGKPVTYYAYYIEYDSGYYYDAVDVQFAVSSLGSDMYVTDANVQAYMYSSDAVAAADGHVGLCEYRSKTVYDITQELTIPAGVETHPLPEEELEPMLVSSFDITLNGEVVSELTLAPYKYTTFKIDNILPETADESLTSLTYTLEKWNESTEQYDAVTAGYTTMNIYTYSGLSVSPTNAMGKYRLTVMYGMASRQLIINVAKSAPTQLPATANGENTDSYSTYVGLDVAIGVALDANTYDASFTAAITSGNEGSTATLIMASEGYTFRATAAGTYVITLTSTAAPSVTDTITIVVNEVPDVATEVLNGNYKMTVGSGNDSWLGFLNTDAYIGFVPSAQGAADGTMYFYIESWWNGTFQGSCTYSYDAETNLVTLDGLPSGTNITVTLVDYMPVVTVVVDNNSNELNAFVATEEDVPGMDSGEQPGGGDEPGGELTPELLLTSITWTCNDVEDSMGDSYPTHIYFDESGWGAVYCGSVVDPNASYAFAGSTSTIYFTWTYSEDEGIVISYDFEGANDKSADDMPGIDDVRSSFMTLTIPEQGSEYKLEFCGYTFTGTGSDVGGDQPGGETSVEETIVSWDWYNGECCNAAGAGIYFSEEGWGAIYSGTSYGHAQGAIYFDWTVSGTDINTTSPSDSTREDFGTDLLTEFIDFAGGFMTYNEADNTISMYGYTFEALPLYG